MTVLLLLLLGLPVRAPAPSCDPAIWKHVYRPSRFKVLDACRVVTGTVRLMRKEKDGELRKPQPL